MRCPQCGYQNVEDDKECKGCGINLAWAVENIKEPCPACNTMNPVVSTRCSTCGLNLEQAREQKKRQEEEKKRQEEREKTRQADMKAASGTATKALISAIVGFFVCAIILGPYAISQARKAKHVLGRGDPGYGQAQWAEILGWIGLAIWALYIIVAIIGGLAGQ